MPAKHNKVKINKMRYVCILKYTKQYTILHIYTKKYKNIKMEHIFKIIVVLAEK